MHYMSDMGMNNKRKKRQVKRSNKNPFGDRNFGFTGMNSKYNFPMTDYDRGSSPYQETDTGPGLMMSGGPMSRDRYRGEVRDGLLQGMELNPAELKYRADDANYRNRMIMQDASDKNLYLDERRGSARQAGYDGGNTRPRGPDGRPLPFNQYPSRTVPVPIMDYVGSQTAMAQPMFGPLYV